MTKPEPDDRRIPLIAAYMRQRADVPPPHDVLARARTEARESRRRR